MLFLKWKSIYTFVLIQITQQYFIRALLAIGIIAHLLIFVKKNMVSQLLTHFSKSRIFSLILENKRHLSFSAILLYLPKPSIFHIRSKGFSVAHLKETKKTTNYAF